MRIKLFAYLLVCMMVMTMFSFTVFAEKQVKIELDGELVSFDVQPIIEKGRTLVPIRSIFEKMGAEVIWNAEENEVTIQDKYKTIEMIIGKKEALIYRKYDFTGIPEKVALEVPAQIVNNRTLLPLRFIAEALEAEVDWDKEQYVGVIKTKDYEPKPDDQGNTPIDYEVLDLNGISGNEKLFQWYEENYKKEGIHSLQIDNEMYVLVSGGERPTGGYRMQVDAVDIQGKSRIASVTATLYRPAPDMMVTQAITYPHVMIKMSAANAAVVRGEIKSIIGYRIEEE
ncbi:hypothetical protein HNQ80_001330 [Anaerosolibacter carboniphilus]|uniref:Protease complex subunit PrcB family protein n=1 Tax=Anaerosolibacter carboniphilus TaxID=1417629 RepID=A0A841KPJ7_9FIRM|nr:stalk domain-containing protein [Anaerosolibacter carboniphilus]MBB6215241.1 hypothetical protein [Anaerosolibacter carboniphilus]